MEFSSNLTLEILNQPFLLEKRIELLFAIQQEGSINKAAKAVPMSYKSAWEAVDAMNNLAPTPIVQKETGGKGGGGTILTEYGKNLLETYTVLKSEQKKFLETLMKTTDLDSGNLKTIGRLAMQLSAGNQIIGIIEKIALGRVNANISFVPKSGHKLFANISKNSVATLDLKEGDEVVGIFKSGDVLIATDESLNLSARNKINGVIEKLIHGEVNCEISINIGKNQIITSVITNDAVEELNLEVGKNVFAIIKSSDLMIGK
jgi:molybdate transport system regulatory protein